MACSIASQPVCSLIWSKTLPATELPVKGRSHLGQPFLKYWRCPILKSFFSWRAKGPKEFSGNSTLPPGKATERKAGGRVRKRFLTLFMNTSSRCQKGETLNSIFPRPIRLVGAELLGRCCSGLPFPSPGDLPHSGIEPESYHSPGVEISMTYLKEGTRGPEETFNPSKFTQVNDSWGPRT